MGECVPGAKAEGDEPTRRRIHRITQLSVRAYWLPGLDQYRADRLVRSGIFDRLCRFRNASTESIFVHRRLPSYLNSIDSRSDTPRRDLHATSRRCVLNSSFSFGYIPKISAQSQEGDGRFYLKHADDKGDHILVDREYNITGIIDWERAHKTSIEVAFNSPIVLLPVSDFYDGVNAIGQDEAYFARVFEEKSHFDMADAVKKGRIQHRFAFCCGYDLADWNGFLGLFQGLRNALMVDEGLDWDSWKGTALHRYREEEGLKILLARDKSM